MYHIFAHTPIWRSMPQMADGGTFTGKEAVSFLSMSAEAGRLCPVGTEIQTLIFDKGKFSEAEAKKWARGHFFKTGVDEKEGTYRMRQEEPDDFTKGSFRTITIKAGIKAVIGCPKNKMSDGGAAEMRS